MKVPFFRRLANRQMSTPKLPEAPGRILREELPVEPSLVTGGTNVDSALSLWFGWRDDAGGIPDWSVFSPTNHPELLTNVALCEKLGERYRCVLIGEVARQWLPTKIAGSFIDEAMPTSNAVDLAMRFDRAFEDGLPNYVEKTMAGNPEHQSVLYRALYLPFASRDDGNARTLTVFDFETELVVKR